MERSLAELESIVRSWVCHVCVERNAAGDCGLEQPSDCSLFQLFPHVAEAIQSVKSDDIQDYIEAIRRDVCTFCVDRASDGYCQKRQQVRCALDAYMLLVVDAIEEATGKTLERRRLGSERNAGSQERPESAVIL